MGGVASCCAGDTRGEEDLKLEYLRQMQNQRRQAAQQF